MMRCLPLLLLFACTGAPTASDTVATSDTATSDTGDTAGIDSADTADTAVADSGDTAVADSGDSGDALAMPDFSLLDANTTSVTYDTQVGPQDQRGRISAWYFAHAT